MPPSSATLGDNLAALQTTAGLKSQAVITAAFCDDFNTFDSTRWNTYTTPGYWGFYNTAGSYDAANTTVENGHLVLKLNHVSGDVTSTTDPAVYRSAVVQSLDRMGYGIYETWVRAANTSNVPATNGSKIDGTFSLFNNYMEYDYADAYYKPDTLIESKYGYGSANDLIFTTYKTNQPETTLQVTTPQNLSQGFHLQRWEWSPSALNFYVDGALVHSVTDPNLIPSEAANLFFNIWPVNKADWNMPGSDATRYTLVDRFCFTPAQAAGTGPSDGDDSDPVPVAAVIDTEITPPAAFAGDEVTFSASGSTGDNLSIRWDFGDGTGAEGDPLGSGDVAHTYTQPGRYTAKLSVSNSLTGERQETTVPIVVMPEIHDMPSSRAAALNGPITFDVGYTVPGLTYEWSFPDGTTSVGPRVTKSFSKPGFADVKLSVTDKRLGVYVEDPEPLYQAFTRVSVTAPKITLALSAKYETSTSNAPASTFPVIFRGDAEIPGGLSIAKRSWKVGGSEFIDGGSTFSYNFTAPGIYPIIHTVVDDLGREFETQAIVAVDGVKGSSNTASSDPTIQPYRPVTDAILGSISYYENQSVNPYANFNSDKWPLTNFFDAGTSRNNVTCYEIGMGSQYIIESATTQAASFPASNRNGGCKPGYVKYSSYGTLGTKTAQYQIYRHPTQLTNPTGISDKSATSFEIDDGPGLYVEGSSILSLYRFVNVPNISINLLPDEQSNDADPVTYDIEGNLFTLFNIPESEVKDGKVALKIPIFFTDQNNRMVSSLNGITRLEFNDLNINQNFNEIVIADGKASINIEIDLKKYSNTADKINLGELKYVFGNFNPFMDASDYSEATVIEATRRTTPIGLDQTANSIVSLSGSSVSSQSLTTLSLRDDLLNAVNLGRTTLSRKNIDNFLKNFDGSAVSVVLGTVPILGDSIDLIGQTYKLATKQKADPVICVLASIGLALDVGTGGVGDVTAPLKALYKLGGPASKEIVAALIDSVRTVKPSVAFNTMKNSAVFMIDVGFKGNMQVVDDALKLAREGGGNALDALGRFTNSYSSIKSQFPGLKSVQLRIKVAKFGMYAPEAAGIIGRCGNKCIASLGETLFEYSIKGFSKTNTLRNFEKLIFNCSLNPLSSNSLSIQSADIKICLKNLILFESRFNSKDLIYGIYYGGDIDKIRKKFSGVLMSKFMDNRKYSHEEIISASKALMESELGKGNTMRFTLSGINDLKGVMAGTASRIPKVTKEEIQYLKDNWSRLGGNVKWYIRDAEVLPPWLWNDPWVSP